MRNIVCLCVVRCLVFVSLLLFCARTTSAVLYLHHADDDNDIELAEIVSKAYLPSITSSSMRDAVNANPHKFIVANEKSVWATEEILHTILRDEMIRII